MNKAERKKPKRSAAERADRHALYEETVQHAGADIDFVDREFKRLTGRRGRLLREDFCGTAKAACEWVRRRRENHAVGVDLDPEVLAWGRKNNLAKLKPAQRDRIELVESDVTKVVTPARDIVLAMNASYWIFKERSDLRNYFRKVRAALVEDGVFFLDCFGGYEAARVGKERRRHNGYTYTWETACFNPLTAALTHKIHFKFDDGSRLKNAFVYDWRLWTIPEIKEILSEAGFGKITVYGEGWDEKAQEGDGDYKPVEEIDADPGWICEIAAQAG